MSAAASIPLDHTAAGASAAHRAETNRANSQHSTGPRTAAGKHRSSQNARRHGLTARTAVNPDTEQGEAEYQALCKKFFEEYEPATATEATMVQHLADTSWRLTRIPQVEDAVLADKSLASQEAIDQVSKLGLYTSRLSRQFQNTVKQLREIQDDRRLEERRQLRAAADLLVEHERKQIPWDPADDGFVFSRSQVEQFATREIRLNDAHLYCSAAFDIPPSFAAASLRRMRARNELAC